ncbi:MAG: hypothetical protein ACI8ZN_000587 [Bacteroidia bacterium]|jgi:hypothetical protein
MKNEFTAMLATRALMIRLIDALSNEQMNAIPNGFNNNIIWNLGHAFVVQHQLTYGLCGLKFDVSPTMIEEFKKGSKPQRAFSANEIIDLCERLLTSHAKFEKDVEKGIFKNYVSYTTSYGVELNNIEQAVGFNNMHEALHLGYAMALARAV